mmetsp:Transcript_23169/g.46249  ORF Transcript_23169/g.46249 Transcript_23169/m.46249 type:complete len:202 (+) Transcript_23169:806-1411(+)
MSERVHGVLHDGTVGLHGRKSRLGLRGPVRRDGRLDHLRLPLRQLWVGRHDLHLLPEGHPPAHQPILPRGGLRHSQLAARPFQRAHVLRPPHHARPLRSLRGAHALRPAQAARGGDAAAERARHGRVIVRGESAGGAPPPGRTGGGAGARRHRGRARTKKSREGAQGGTAEALRGPHEKSERGRGTGRRRDRRGHHTHRLQ